MGRTTAVLLAAGAGTRLGRGPKALLPFRGTTLVSHAVTEVLAGGCQEVVVVLGAGASAVRAAGLPLGARAVENPDWAHGMGGSFAVGVAAVGLAESAETAAQNPPAEDILVALVDQPGMNAALVARLLGAHAPGRITAAGYRDKDSAHGELRRGHPIVFAARWAVAAAATASGDAGARVFLRAHPELLDVIDCSDLGDGADVDTVEQLHLLE